MTLTSQVAPGTKLDFDVSKQAKYRIYDEIY